MSKFHVMIRDMEKDEVILEVRLDTLEFNMSRLVEPIQVVGGFDVVEFQPCRGTFDLRGLMSLGDSADVPTTGDEVRPMTQVNNTQEEEEYDNPFDDFYD